MKFTFIRLYKFYDISRYVSVMSGNFSISASGDPSLMTILPKKIMKRTICENHFEDNFKLKKRLSTYAIPTLLLPEPINIDEHKVACLNTNENAITNLLKNDLQAPNITECNDYDDIRGEEVAETRRDRNEENPVSMPIIKERKRKAKGMIYRVFDS
ncbi:uncharacterized protein LOC112590415 isoform X2 [Harpegnathos saltator]|uniref:uncharacterized protein LOC112590415 isoform X2 n=1 Tax=Harpegnathos saltator TaxID=610380 RepID=UPI000DBEE12B|nr:uncharacterized protein LOC112590415 isoform X2 [Harpegnathos saltator]